MTSIPLSEQLGAMAFVDELRHQQMQLQEHLNLPKRRAEVAARIRDYYQSHNIAFDEALIDQGVREFFARRLMFEAPPLSWREKLLSKASMARGQLYKLFLAIIAAALITQCTRIAHDSGITVEIENSARDLRWHDEDVRTEIQLNHKQLEQWQQKALAQPDVAVSRILDQVRQTLPPLDQTFASDVPQFVRKTNRDSVKTLVTQREAQIKLARQAISSARSGFATVEGIYQQRDKLARLLAMRPIPKASSRSPISRNLPVRLTSNCCKSRILTRSKRPASRSANWIMRSIESPIGSNRSPCAISCSSACRRCRWPPVTERNYKRCSPKPTTACTTRTSARPAISSNTSSGCSTSPPCR